MLNKECMYMFRHETIKCWGWKALRKHLSTNPLILHRRKFQFKRLNDVP